MKKTILFLIACSTIISVNAQYQSIFGQNSTSWEYDYILGLGPNNYTHVTTGNDTLINGKVYKVIHDISNSYTLFVREDTTKGSVFKIDNSSCYGPSEIEIMTLTLSVGDTFNSMIVDSIYNDLNGRKIIKLNYYGTTLKFIEGIGFNARCIVRNWGSIDDLVCSYKDGIRVFTNDLGISCTTIGIKENAFKQIKIYPNPSKDFVNLELEHPKPSHFKIFNLNGAIVLEGQLEFKTEIKVQHFPSGLYIIEFSNGESTFYQKFVKQ